jgi:hypothetical protein
MASREQPLIIGSPFKTGFYAGPGFFFASILMTVLTVLSVVVMGFGTALSLGTAAHFMQNSSNPVNSAPIAQPSAYRAGAPVVDGQ